MPAALAADPTGNAASIERELDALAFPEAPGCAVAVAKAGDRVLQRAWGLASLEHQVPITLETRFEAGSAAKQFTAATVLLLAAEGTLALTDDIRKYLPELPDHGATVTIDHLLTHTSGLRDWRLLADLAGWPLGTRAHDLEYVLATAVRQRGLNHAPGAEFSYTNTGYHLLPLIVERATGETFPRISTRLLFEPLGMDATLWRDDFARVIPDRAIAYRRSIDGYRQDMPFESAYGAGGLVTTAGDLMRWHAALESGRFPAALRAQLEQATVLEDGRRTSYGRGLALGIHDGVDVIGHGGETGGYRAWTGRYPRQQLAIAVLCNSDSPDIGALSRTLASAFLETENTEAPDAQPSPEPSITDTLAALTAVPEALDHDPREFVGRYASDEADATILVRVAGGRLVAHPAHAPSRAKPLRAVGEDRFRYGAWTVEAFRDESLRIDRLEMSRPGARGVGFVRDDP